MRRAFIRALIEIAEHDRRVLLLTADLGFSVVEPLCERFPARFFNVGVAEQNLIGLATGLAEGGYLPFAYSIVPFAVLRSYEFIRNGPVAHRLPVRVVGIGGGFEYGPAGLTHYGLEDVAVARVQPGLGVIAPADYRQAVNALKATWDAAGPVYYRIGRDEEREVPGLDGRFQTGRLHVVTEGEHVLLLALGSMAMTATETAERLRSGGVNATVAVVSCIAPPPTEDLVRLLSRFRLVVTAEAHYKVGGLASLVAELIAGESIPCRLAACGVAGLPETTGAQAHMEARSGLDAGSLAATVMESLQTESRRQSQGQSPP